MESGAENAWVEYAQRKRAERLAEADRVWSALIAGGGDAETILAIDFVHFGASRAAVDALHSQLSENYTGEVESGPENYWLLKSTTRPYGFTLSAADHLSWVGFMCDVAESHGCVFSTWSLSAPSLGLTVSSESVEDGG